ncbi:MAG: helix-turn-helix domain-containing protein [Patescibacteria group bacterium]|nr:helix-turn-helix domain-containing protein [Patescibacteria group bacterium]
MEQELLKLGFSLNQARVYLALLELGQSRVGPIITKSKLPRQTVYNTLSELEEKELIFSVIKSGRKNFQTKDPQQLLENIRIQEETFEKILPQLITKRDTSKNISDIKVYEGLDGFKTVHMTNIRSAKKDSIVYFISAGSQKWVDFAKESGMLYKYEKIRLEKNITQKFVVYESQREAMDHFTNTEFRDQLPSQRRQYRFLQENFNSPVSIQIWQDRIDLVIFSNSPIIFEIKNIEVVKSFKNYFNFLWGIAKD